MFSTATIRDAERRRRRRGGGDRGTINREGEERSNNYDVSVWVERRWGVKLKCKGRHFRTEA